MLWWAGYKEGPCVGGDGGHPRPLYLVIITFSIELAAVGWGAVGRPGSPDNVRSVAQVGHP